MTNEEKELYALAADACAAMGKKNSEPENNQVGICSNLLCLNDRQVDVVIARWPDRSKNIFYPVKHPTNPDSQAGYHSKKNKWTGEYGNRRRKLARFMAKEFRKMANAL